MIPCERSEDIAEIKTDIKHILLNQEKFSAKLDSLASKREINIHRGLIASLWSAIISLFWLHITK